MDTQHRPTVEFDHHGPEYSQDPWGTASELANTCPVAWSENHGGFWVVSGYDAVVEASRDAKLFSSRHDLPTGCTAFQGINIPPAPGRYLPIELDPPEQLEWRRALGAMFAPGAVDAMKPLMHAYSDWALDQCIESGEIDFVMGLAAPVPALVTLHLLGLPLSRWRTYAEMTHAINYSSGDERQRTFEMFDAMLGEIVVVARERRENPTGDLLSLLATMEVAGQRLSDEDIASACGTIVAGGIDTTAAVVAGALKHLGEHTEVRQRLIDDPALIPQAMEEFLRFISPVTSLGRTAVSDTELGGQQIKAGDRLILMWHGANMDASVFQNPTELDIDRGAANHVTFGSGVHRCIGSRIARADIPIMLEHVLTRMPDYELVPGGAVRYPSIGVSNNYIAVPAIFTPGARVGVSPELTEELASA
ncbi:cytochrome P450 [Jatrophihabitans sp.]|uniref:cytochrome P450 n=1 Tax=Jatrophihabitans sp. TaxID=1932789 RepID=UPI0030C6C57B|nr:cytochrome [Jatrophihabitans sp.]